MERAVSYARGRGASWCLPIRPANGAPTPRGSPGGRHEDGRRPARGLRRGPVRHKVSPTSPTGAGREARPPGHPLLGTGAAVAGLLLSLVGLVG
ncbi:hypothetical protein AB0M68_23015 [Streptomyces sp. NPDC051453]|uniref:hypothetical protein n=1 Tax=Streptomyces sp. NPDC051453 TaxID=3154941 RepID=UPI00341FAD2B